ESYDKQGVLRSETQAASQTVGQSAASGVPGVLSNTPPPQTTASSGLPQGAPTAAPTTAAPAGNGESSATRNFELGREVSVANGAPGKIKRLSVAVALSNAAMKKAKAADIDQIKQLVSAAVGADPARGDQVAVMVRAFDAAPVDKLPFYEQAWFLTVVRYLAALIGVLLVLLLAVRPLIKALKREPGDAPTSDAGQVTAAAARMSDPITGAVDAALLGRQVNLAQRLVAEQPDSAVQALREMLSPPVEAAA
ncbi:MAG: flagellar M-ring protein FliF C-terminal domain-containing protein, partial [Novosphingobium sp.]